MDSRRLCASLCVASAIAALSTANASECRIDQAKVLSWSKFGTLTNATNDTTLTVYEGCNRRLVFVAAQHSNDPKSKTYALVTAAFSEFKPKFVVLEGFPQSMGVSPAPLLEHSPKVAGTPADAEPYLSVRLAQASGTPFVGGEPDDSDVLAEAKTKGLTTHDVFAFYVLRKIPQWLREGKLKSHTDPALETLIRKFAAAFARDAKVGMDEVADTASVGAFKAWYKKTNGTDFETGFREQDSWPTSPESNRPTNRLSDIVADARDKHIVTVVDQALSDHGVVLVVYGASHFDIQSPAFEAAFGKPKMQRR